MAEMKDSGTTWLGMIPKDWELSKISSIYELRMQKVSDKDYPPLSVTMNGIVPQLASAAKTNAHDDRKLVKKGDFAINSRSDRRGSCGVSEYDGSVSLINTVMKPRDEMNPDYYNWLFHTMQFADEFYKWGHGIVDDLWTTNWQDMKHIDIPVPTLDEQRVIADYLNKAISEIDALHTDIEKQIGTLEEYKKTTITEAVTKGLDPDVEMKNSGIEWIGEIPQKWECKKVKYSCKTRNEKYDITHGRLNYFALENLVSWNMKYIETENEYDVSGTNLCYKNDVVFGKLRPYLAKTFLVDYDRCCSTEFAVFHSFQGLPKYYLYVFTTQGFVKTVDDSTLGVKMPRANIEFIKNVFIPVAPKSEQQQIVDYLDSKCTEIDGIIFEKKKQLETLEQYKKSLIYEYVTGKKEVK